MQNTFQLTLTDGDVIRSGDFASGPCSLHQKDYGVVIVHGDTTSTFPWRRVKRVEVTDTPSTSTD